MVWSSPCIHPNVYFPSTVAISHAAGDIVLLWCPVRLRFHICLVLLVGFQLEAQQLPFQRFGKDDGLADHAVTALAQDARGFLWIGTTSGAVHRFDGREFIRFGGRTNGMETAITALASDGKHLFIGTLSGVLTLRLMRDAGDQVDTALNHLLSRVTEPVTCIEVRKTGAVYIETRTQAWTFQPDHGTIRQCEIVARSMPFPSPRRIINATAVDCAGRAWIATDIGLFRQQGDSLMLMDIQTGFPQTGVHALCTDHEGNLWCGTPEGLFRLTPDRFQLYPISRFPSSQHGKTVDLGGPDGGSWFGSSGAGSMNVSPDGVRRLTRRDGLASDSVNDILVRRDGSILFATSNGLSFYHLGRWKTFSIEDGLPDMAVSAIVPSRRGWYWLGTQRGLVRWDGAAFSRHAGVPELPSENITALLEDNNGDVWIGTDKGAALISATARDRLIRLGKLQDVHITSVFADSLHRIWFGTIGQGVFVIQDGKTLRVTKEDGLAGNSVYFVSEDRFGTLYFGTNAGLSLLPRAHMRISDGSFRWSLPFGPVPPSMRSMSFFTLTEKTGLMDSDFRSGSAQLDRNGHMWLQSSNGVTGYSPIDLENRGDWFVKGCTGTLSIPRLMVSELRIDESPVRVVDTLDLPAGSATLRMRLLLPTFRNPDDLRFLYRLDEEEYSWHVSNDGEIVLNRLRPGTYTLVVKATVGEGVWTDRQKVLTIVIQPPFHETAWFWTIAILTVAFILYAFHRNQTIRAVERERKRLLVATDLQESIGESLSSISLLGEFESKRRTSLGDSDIALLFRIRSLARNALEAMSDIVWSINPAHDNLQSLVDRMGAIAQSSEHGHTAVHVRVLEARLDIPLSVEERRNLLMLFKTVFDTATKHSMCKGLLVTLRTMKRTIDLEFRLDGLIIQSSESGDMFRGIGARAKAMRWDFAVSPAQRGTMLHVSVNR